MDTVKLERRTWDQTEHLRHINDGEWVPMKDVDGKPLPGIVGKRGVAGEKSDGTRIGADVIRMEPGASFPHHEHQGDHEIYFISGRGFVHINGEDIVVEAGHMIHIPGEYPHGVWVDPTASEPLLFFAVGHPHKHVDAEDRMRHPKRRS